jgi:hypothetical protein
MLFSLHISGVFKVSETQANHELLFVGQVAHELGLVTELL